MGSAPDPQRATYLSTGVVARALRLEPQAVRAMIEVGTLPEPQWMNLGHRVERIYSIEWLILASEQLNVRRLAGLELEIGPSDSVQIALRFDQPSWTLDSIGSKVTALQDLWKLCASTLAGEEHFDSPTLHVHRLSAGSPLDLLIWAGENWPQLVEVIGGTGGVAALFLYVLKNPAKVAEALPRMIASWHEGWAAVDESKVHRAEARLRRDRFEKDGSTILSRLDAVPSESALVGDGAVRLELFPPPGSAEGPHALGLGAEEPEGG